MGAVENSVGVIRVKAGQRILRTNFSKPACWLGPPRQPASTPRQPTARRVGWAGRPSQKRTYRHANVPAHDFSPFHFDAPKRHLFARKIVKSLKDVTIPHSRILGYSNYVSRIITIQEEKCLWPQEGRYSCEGPSGNLRGTFGEP